MTTHTITRELDAPRSGVWNRMATHERWSALAPTVTKAYAVNAIPHPDRACRLAFSGADAVRLLERRPGNVSDVVVRIGVMGDEHGATVTASMSYQPRFGRVGELLDRPLRARRIESILNGLLDDVELTADAPIAGPAPAFGAVVYEAA